MDFTTILAGVIGGAIVLVTEQIYLFFRERSKDRKQLLITFPNSARIIDKTVFEKLSPGRSVELMKTALGTPDKTYLESDPIFEEYREEEQGLLVRQFNSEEEREKYEESKYEITAYFYDLKNAQIKVTSKDKMTIDSLAVEVKEGTVDASDLPLGWIQAEDEKRENLLLGKTKVTKDLVESSRLEYVFSRYDNIFVLSIFTAAPLYTHYSYFGYPEHKEDIEVSKDNPESFIGGTITGVCLHQDEYNCYIIRGYDNL